MRTQIALDPEQHARVKQKASSLGITMAEYIRRLVDSDLAGVDPQASPAAIIGIGRSGGSDIARDGKSAVADAVGDRTTSSR
jgi:hypothetical protein